LLAVPLVLAVLAIAPTASAQPWPVAPASDGAEQIAQLFWFTLVLATIVFVLVEGLLIYSSLRFRRRTGIPTFEPPQIHGNTRLEVMWATVPALILIGLFGITVTRLGDLNQIPTDPGVMHIGVTGQQFSWTFTYGDTGVKTTNDLHLEVGQQVVFDVTSVDVIHGFWVPDLFGQIDANPGRMNHISYTPKQEGQFRGVCAMLCGAGHSGMMFTVTTQSHADFQTWLTQEQSGGAPAVGAPGSAAAGDPTVGAQLIQQKGCPACHTIPGIPGANGTIGPNLGSHDNYPPVGQRPMIATYPNGVVPNTGPADLKAWIMNPPALKPGTLMPNLGLTDEEATNIVAYLETIK
jgi:cytochrome c oxidase subunit 2